MKTFSCSVILWLVFVVSGCGQTSPSSENTTYPMVKSDREWLELLGPEAYHVLREKGTERAFTSPYNDEKRRGTYCCAGCGLALFHSDQKFNSGTGWPSYWSPIHMENVGEVTDVSYGMLRTEVVCNQCGGHLGHVFDDGPRPTGLRYCINGVSLFFNPEKD